MAQPGCATRIRVGVRDGIRDVIRPGPKKSALVRDVESGVGGRRGDAGEGVGTKFSSRCCLNEFYFSPCLEDSKAVITQPFVLRFYGTD